MTDEIMKTSEISHFSVRGITKFYGYGEICSIGAADAHETLSSTDWPLRFSATLLGLPESRAWYIQRWVGRCTTVDF